METASRRRSVNPSTRAVTTAALVPVILMGAGRTAGAQSIAQRVAAVNTGVVRMVFAAKPGVCGDGHNVNLAQHRRNEHWESACDTGPVRVVLTVTSREVIDVDTYVGGQWRAGAGATDLGTVSAPAAAAYLLDLVARADTKVAKEAILPALLADSTEAWPRLLAVAKDDDRPRDVRKRALFWVAQSAGERVAADLGQIVDDPSEDSEVKNSAIFAISRLADDRGVPMLIDIARTNPQARVRKQALFWLSRSEDPRAIAVFEEILTKGR